MPGVRLEECWRCWKGNGETCVFIYSYKYKYIFSFLCVTCVWPQEGLSENKSAVSVGFLKSSRVRWRALTDVALHADVFSWLYLNIICRLCLNHTNTHRRSAITICRRRVVFVSDERIVGGGGGGAAQHTNTHTPKKDPSIMTWMHVILVVFFFF